MTSISSHKSSFHRLWGQSHRGYQIIIINPREFTVSQEIQHKEVISEARFNSGSSENVCWLAAWKEWENQVWSLRVWLWTVPLMLLRGSGIELYCWVCVGPWSWQLWFSKRKLHPDGLSHHNGVTLLWFVTSQFSLVSYKKGKKTYQRTVVELFKLINGSRKCLWGTSELKELGLGE